MAVLLAGLAGGSLALVHAVACVSFGTNQVVTGSRSTCSRWAARPISAASSCAAPTSSECGPSRSCRSPLADLPVLGSVLFRQTLLVYLLALLSSIATSSC